MSVPPADSSASLLIGLPDLKRGALALLSPQEAQRVDRLLNEVTETISYSLLGNLAISVIAGSVVFVVAVAASIKVVLADLTATRRARMEALKAEA